MPSPRPLVLRASPSGDAFFGNDGDVLTCQGGDVWEAEPGGNFSQGFIPRGVGAKFKTFFETDQNIVWVTDFMTAAEQADCFNGTMLFDLQPAIQNAINYAIQNNSINQVAGGPRIRLPAGVLRIDRTIQLGYGAGISPFRSVIFEGEGQHYGGNQGNQGSGTSIQTTFTDAPAISCQGLWFAQVRNFSIFGLNTNWVVALLSTPTMSNLDVTNWIDPSFPASASSQFAVQCAIAIDPYSGAQPAVHYPDVPYPAFLGPQTQYGKNFSSNIKFENIYIQGFVAGIALQPSNNDNNGDFMRFENVAIFYSAYGFVWGNSQARVNTFDNCNLAGLHTGFCNNTFGTQGGNAQLLVRSTSLNLLIQWANMDIQNGGGPQFLHCFCEACYSLGPIGVNASNGTPVEFYDCEMGFSAWDFYGIPINLCALNGRRIMTTFRQCRFFLNSTAGPTLAWGAIHFPTGGQVENGSIYRFEDCGVTYPSGEPTQLWQKCALNATAGLAITTLSTRFQGYDWRVVHRYNLDTGASVSSWTYGKLNTGDRTRCLPAYGQKACGSSFGADPGVDLTWRIGGINTTGAPIIAGRNITVTYAAPWTADAAMRLGGDVGDVIEDVASGTVYWVYSRTGLVVSARAQTGFDSSGNLLSPPGNNASFWGLNCRRYCPGIFGGDVALYGDLAAGNNTITNVVDGSGAAFDASTVITIGDWLYQEPAIDKLFVSDAACKVAGIALGTITMTGNAVRTIVHQRLAIFTRPPMPNGTPTP